MGNSHSHSQPTVTEVHRPRLLRHYKSSPLSLRPSRTRESPPTSTSSSSSLNSFSEKDIEREKENRRPNRTTGSQARLSPPSCATSIQPPPVPVYSPHILLPSPAAGFLSPAPSRGLVSDYDTAYSRFLHDYPQYASSWHVDALRRSEYSRLGPDETYVDYMGGALYPTSLISVHSEFLQGAVLGNTHSESPRFVSSSQTALHSGSGLLMHIRSSKLSAALAATARAAVLSLSGRPFPSSPGSAFLLPEDAHNSVHGIREFARAKGAPIVYLPSPPRGGVRVQEAYALIDEHRPSTGTPALFAYTGQSNITNSKPPLAVLAHAAMRGFTTLLDAAALAPTTPIDLTSTPVDAVAVSFYKMFGFPTGIGALVLAPGIGAWLREKRPWFAGGTVDVVQVPGLAVGRTAAIDEAFEDGTLNYTLLPAVTTGLRLLGAYLPALPTRIAALSASCTRTLEDLRWPRSGSPAVRVLSRIPGAAPESGETAQGAGGVVSCLMLDEKGDPVPLSRVAAHAAANGIALRTGCMCNPGGAAAMLSLSSLMSVLGNGDMNQTPTLQALEEAAGRELGVVRISFGLASCWADVWRGTQG
ncbi:PLP-dependent transferase [Lactarius psammicola]|nr:PLP-dependent transferase [Lactarius psammicola]